MCRNMIQACAHQSSSSRCRSTSCYDTDTCGRKHYALVSWAGFCHALTAAQLLLITRSYIRPSRDSRTSGRRSDDICAWLAESSTQIQSSFNQSWHCYTLKSSHSNAIFSSSFQWKVAKGTMERMEGSKDPLFLRLNYGYIFDELLVFFYFKSLWIKTSAKCKHFETICLCSKTTLKTKIFFSFKFHNFEDWNSINLFEFNLLIL